MCVCKAVKGGRRRSAAGPKIMEEGLQCAPAVPPPHTHTTTPSVPSAAHPVQLRAEGAGVVCPHHVLQHLLQVGLLLGGQGGEGGGGEGDWQGKVRVIPGAWHTPGCSHRCRSIDRRPGATPPPTFTLARPRETTAHHTQTGPTTLVAGPTSAAARSRGQTPNAACSRAHGKDGTCRPGEDQEAALHTSTLPGAAAAPACTHSPSCRGHQAVRLAATPRGERLAPWTSPWLVLQGAAAAPPNNTKPGTDSGALLQRASPSLFAGQCSVYNDLTGVASLHAIACVCRPGAGARQ